MAHKTFISYKYSESKDLRDRIIDALGDDATYYKGETSDSGREPHLYLCQMGRANLFLVCRTSSGEWGVPIVAQR